MELVRFSSSLVVVLGLSFAVSAAGDANTVSSGVIRFTGAIVEGACDMNAATNNLEARCARSGQSLPSKLSVNPNSAVAEQLPASFGTSQLHWVDNAKKQAIMMFAYY